MSFDLAGYRALLEGAQAGGYRFAGFDRPPADGDLLIRHDVDMSLNAAVRMAEVEAEAGVSTWWFLMTRSVFYNLASPEGERTIARLRELGGRIGLHALRPHVDLDERFEPFVSWHNPEPAWMSEPIPGAQNVMAPPFFVRDHYRSDSNQHWRNGDPRDAVARGEFTWLHILIHPVIWVYGGKTMAETMQSFLDADRTARHAHLRADRIDLE